jgi:hypothetical protein
MKAVKWIMIAGVLTAAACLAIAVFLVVSVGRDYSPVRYYEVDVIPETICASHVVPVKVSAYIDPPIDSLVVDPTWISSEPSAFQEEPVAEFTGAQLPVKIDRVSPLTHVSPNKAGTWTLKETLVAEGRQGGVTRTQDYVTQDKTPTKVVECGK